MKIICVDGQLKEKNPDPNATRPEELVFFLKPETSLIRAGLPFFVPDFSKRISCRLQIVTKICKLGKHIQPRFAHTYYREAGLGLDFAANDIFADCIQRGLPWEKARAFDGSSAVGSFHPEKELFLVQDDCSLKKNDKPVFTEGLQKSLLKRDMDISYVSKWITIKMGDFLFTDTGIFTSVEAGDFLEVFRGKKKILDILVK